MELLPDLGSLSDEGLKQLIDDLEDEEHQVSYRRRVLHGQIDILRAELVARLPDGPAAAASSTRSTSTGWRRSSPARRRRRNEQAGDAPVSHSLLLASAGS